jgi:hypothetical protein
MLSNLSRNWKIAIAVAVATIVVLATTLGVVLPPARERTVSAATGTSQETTGASGTEQDGSDPPTESPTGSSKVLPCPCFNGDDLDKAFADIISGDPSLSFDKSATCNGDKYGQSINYSQNGHMMGYAVDNSLSFESSCKSFDMIRIITPEEGAACSLIMDEKCTEHASALDEIPDAPIGGNADAVECPCFAATSVEAFMVDNNLPLEKGSCAASGDHLYIAYSDGRSYYRWGVEISSDGSELTCSEHDTIRILKLQTEWDACKRIVDDACANIVV